MKARRPVSGSSGRNDGVPAGGSGGGRRVMAVGVFLAVVAAVVSSVASPWLALKAQDRSSGATERQLQAQIDLMRRLVEAQEKDTETIRLLRERVAGLDARVAELDARVLELSRSLETAVAERSFAEPVVVYAEPATREEEPPAVVPAERPIPVPTPVPEPRQAVAMPTAPANAPAGRVTAAANRGLLVALGRSDGVREGMHFRVFRAARWIGDVRVTRVFGSQAACETARSTTVPFRVGDVARLAGETGNF